MFFNANVSVSVVICSLIINIQCHVRPQNFSAVIVVVSVKFVELNFQLNKCF